MKRFLTEEAGAVTVDWVVLTAGIVGLGLVTTAVVSAGVENMSNDIASDLGGISIRDRFVSFAQSMGFEAGSGNWMGGTISDDAYGNVLRMGGTSGLQGAQATYDLEEGMAFAVVSFDMHAIDSWDGESFQIFIDNQVVATASFDVTQDGATGSWVSDNPDISFAMEPTSGRSNVGYASNWSDQSYRMQVTVAQPGDQITVGFGSTLDQSVDDESWAVDNIEVVSTNNGF